MKKKTVITLIIVILLLVATLGISVAYFSYGKSSLIESNVTTGDITFKYTEDSKKGRGINIEDANPISDSEGKRLDSYFDFTIEANLVHSDMLYEVEIEEISGSTIPLSGVKVYITELTNNSEKDIQSNYDINGKVKKISDYTNGVIYQERILKNTKNYEKHFRVRIWIDEDVDIYTDNYINTAGSFRINVNARSNSSMVDASIPTPVITGGTGLEKVLEPQTIRLANNPAIGGVAYYEYYITDDANDIPTDTTIATGQTQEKILIDIKKPKYIYFRLVTNDGAKSAWSNVEIVNYGSLCEIEPGTVVKQAGYTGAADPFTVPCDGNYKVELWGASGANFSNYSGGSGSYTAGNIGLNEDSTLYIYVGGQGTSVATPVFNNSRSSCYSNGTANNGASCSFGANGGGATDIRFFDSTPSSTDLEWDSNLGLNSRIIVSASGSGAEKRGEGYGEGNGGNAGGLTGYPGNRVNYSKYGTTNWDVATQTTLATITYNNTLYNSFFGNAKLLNSSTGTAPSSHITAGNGYYAGAGTAHGSGSGGSSYISGHTGCVAIKEGSTTEPREVNITGCETGTTDIECSKHYSGLYFVDTKMIDGAGYNWTNVKGSLEQMPNTNGGYYASGVGHTGDGYAKITYLGD